MVNVENNKIKIIVFERLRERNIKDSGTVTCIGKINSEEDNFGGLFPYFTMKSDRLMFLYKYDIISVRNATKEEELIFDYKYKHCYDNYILPPFGDEKRNYVELFDLLSSGNVIQCHFNFFTKENLCIEKRYEGEIFMDDGRIYLNSKERNLKKFEICLYKNKYNKTHILEQMKTMNLSYIF